MTDSGVEMCVCVCVWNLWLLLCVELNGVFCLGQFANDTVRPRSPLWPRGAPGGEPGCKTAGEEGRGRGVI